MLFNLVFVPAPRHKDSSCCCFYPSPAMASLTTTTRVESKLQTRAPRCRQPLRVRATQSPEVKRPERVVEPPKRLFSDAAPAASTAAPSASAAAHAEPLSTVGGVTIEYQRQRAKEMTKYFRELKLNEQMVKSQVFGWTRSNEINNGRWVSAWARETLHGLQMLHLRLAGVRRPVVHAQHVSSWSIPPMLAHCRSCLVCWLAC